MAIFRNAPKERRDEDWVLSASKSFVPVPGYRKGSLTLPHSDRIPYLALGDGPLPVIYIPGEAIFSPPSSTPHSGWPSTSANI